jgi:hypothetical protein
LKLVAETKPAARGFRLQRHGQERRQQQQEEDEEQEEEGKHLFRFVFPSLRPAKKTS